MRLCESVHLVGSGDAGVGLTGPLDCNVYAITTSESVWLIDAGLQSADQVLDNLEQDGLDLRSVTHVFVTHHHADHAGALAALKARLPDLQVAVAAEVADAVRSGDEISNSLAWARDLGYYPADFSLTPCDVDIELTDGWSIVSANTRLTAVSTPGHCRGHFAFLVTGTDGSSLFCGDQVFGGGKVLLQNVPDASIRQSAESMTRLAALEFEGFFPGHGVWSVARGHRHVEAAAVCFDSIGVPQNLV